MNKADGNLHTWLGDVLNDGDLHTWLSDALKQRMSRRLKNGLGKAICLATKTARATGDDNSIAICGGACNADIPHDYDIYQLGTQLSLSDVLSDVQSDKCFTVLSRSRNALTVCYSGKVLQFCTYTKPTLSELVESFDFAHIQAGVQLHIQPDCNTVDIHNVEFTPDYMKAHISDTTWFTGSDYPLSSIMRVCKYKERGVFGDKSWRLAMLQAFVAAAIRGFKDYDDFKDQLAAIDLFITDDGNEVYTAYKQLAEHGFVTVLHDGEDDGFENPLDAR